MRISDWSSDVCSSDLTTATLLLSIPSFWLGLLMLLVFGIQLGWLPVVGYVGFAEDFWRAIGYIVLPVATLTMIEIGLLTRMARASTIEEIGRPCCRGRVGQSV